MPEKDKGEVDKFFENLKGEDTEKVDIFEEENKEGTSSETKKDGDTENLEKDGEPHKNRRHRRLEAQLQQEREARIAAEAAAAALASENAKSRVQGGGEEPPVQWLKMYGDSAESRQAWLLNKEILASYAEQAKKGALEEFETKRKTEAAEVKKFEELIDSELEGIEDEYNVDLTSNAPAARKARREFLELVQKLSPKDESGSITAYADFDETWQQYSLKKTESEKSDNSKQKELANRSMTKSAGNEGAAEKQKTSGFFGWRKDLNITD